jgi:hypothetical protein
MSKEDEARQKQKPYEGTGKDAGKPEQQEGGRWSTTTAVSDEQPITSESQKSDWEKLPEEERERLANVSKPFKGTTAPFASGKSFESKGIVPNEEESLRQKQESEIVEQESKAEIEQDFLRQKKADNAARKARSDIKEEAIKSKQREQQSLEGKQPYEDTEPQSLEGKQLKEPEHPKVNQDIK